MDELDGEYDDPLDITDPSLGADGATSKGRRVERKEMTESEIGVSDSGVGLKFKEWSTIMLGLPGKSLKEI